MAGMHSFSPRGRSSCTAIASITASRAGSARRAHPRDGQLVAPLGGGRAAARRRYTVIAPDLIGHGDSATPRGDYSLGAHAAGIRDLLAAIGIERATIVGHSLGGGVAMQFFYQFPQRTERLVLVSSGGLGHEVSPLLRGAALPGASRAAVAAATAACSTRCGAPASGCASAASGTGVYLQASRARCARSERPARARRSCRRCAR